MDLHVELARLADAYLLFLVTRDDSVVKAHLCVDFVRRRNTTQQIKLIQKLPQFVSYGIGPEAHLWEEYGVLDDDDGEVCITPFQFNVSYRNPGNPLETEFMRITIHKLIREDGVWKIGAIISPEEEKILLRLIATQQSDLSSGQLQSFV